MTTVARHRSLRALLLGLALFAAACGGGDDSVSTEAADSADDTTAESTPASEGDAEEAGSADDTMADESDATAGDEETSAASDGEESSASADGPPPSLPPEEARAAAEQNVPNLQVSDDVRDIEVVSVYDGSITSLREVVTGDRPVLVWFWAPH